MRCCLAVFASLVATLPAAAQIVDRSKEAQAFRQGRPVEAIAPDTLLVEAEEFQVASPGWQAQPFGKNYYAATFANAFLSRKGFLGAPEKCAESKATLEVNVPTAGKYLALVRYEAPYRFESRFRLVVEQNGKKVLDRLYGSRDNLRIWPFREGLKKEVAWSWGAGENLVWEGHDAFVQLQPGKATLTLIAGPQPGEPGRRNVDCLVLTTDLAGVQHRLAKENYLPLDGLLTQAGDVFLKVHNKAPQELRLTVPNGTEHSPYWVHLRTWKPKAILAKAGETTDWVEVGSLLDTLSDGQWTLQAAGKGPHDFDLEFAVRDAAGKIATIARFEGNKGNVALAYDADTRYSRRIRLQDEVLYDLVAYLRKHPVQGQAPRRTLIYGYTFPPKPEDAKYTAALSEFLKMMGATALGRGVTEDQSPGGLISGYIDVRGVATGKLEDYCKKLQAEGRADKIATVSLGDEIGLPHPPAKDHASFHAFLKSKNLKPSDLDPTAGGDWSKIAYNPSPKIAQALPGLYYWSRIWSYRYGIQAIKARTDILRKYLPNAGIGANFSPHHGALYIGPTHHWISVFREQGMTLPWGEDYIWQVQVGSQQMNSIMLDMYRCAVRPFPRAKIHYYVMPHTPGNTTAAWRRQFYGDLAHGAKVLNLFEFRPVQFGYTENHCSDPAMYQEIRKSFHELGTFEDIVQDGTIPTAQAAMFFSEASDVWDDLKPPFAAAKRTLWSMIRHQQTPLDFVVEGDDLKDRKVLFLLDRHVSRAASQAIAAWVEQGGTLFATAGAGMFDEYDRANETLRKLLGIEHKGFEESKDPVVFEKQDLPFAERLARVAKCEATGNADIDVFGLRSIVLPEAATEIQARFDDGKPALTRRRVGKGQAYCCAFLPGLSYYQPALPKRPVDRGMTDDTYSHFLAVDFDKGAQTLVESCTGGSSPVRCDHRLVESMVLRSDKGVAIPLINWHPDPVKGLKVVVDDALSAGRKASLATGAPVRVEMQDGRRVFVLDLAVADTLLLR